MLRLIGALLATVVAGCAERDPPDPTRPDPSGDAPARIVSLAPAITIMLRDVGALDLIVGRHAWDTVADPSLPVCGDQTGIDYELLIDADPDVVITQWGSRELPERLRALADERGWELIDTRLLTLADVVETANEIDRRFGARAAGESEADALLGHRMLDAITRPPDSFPGVGRVLLLHQASPPAALGPGSFHHELLERMHLTPAIEQGAPYMRLDAEDVLELAPDAIVLIPATPAARAPRTIVPRDRGWDRFARRLGALAPLPIPAIERRRVAAIEHPHALIPSTSLIELADRLAAIAESWSEPE